MVDRKGGGLDCKSGVGGFDAVKREGGGGRGRRAGRRAKRGGRGVKKGEAGGLS